MLKCSRLLEVLSTVAFLWMNKAAGHNIYQGSHSNLRIKIRDFFRTWDTKKSAPIFEPFSASSYEFDSKTRHCKIKKKLKMQHQCNTSLSLATTIATALLNINDDKQESESNSSVTNYSSATDAWFFSTTVTKYQQLFRTNAQFQDFSGPDFSLFIFQDFSGPAIYKLLVTKLCKSRKK